MLKSSTGLDKRLLETYLSHICSCREKIRGGGNGSYLFHKWSDCGFFSHSKTDLSKGGQSLYK